MTGTNGKTSVTYMVEHILNSEKKYCGVIGTVNHHLTTNEKTYTWKSSLTTPPTEQLFPKLKEFKDLNAQAVAMEISSHALDQERVDGLQINTALFTNISEDHLDYHKNFKHYFESKKKLFSRILRKSQKKDRRAIIHFFGTQTLELLEDDCKTIIIFNSKDLNPLDRKKLEHQGKSIEIAHYKIMSFDLHKMKILLNYKEESLEMTLPLLGSYQAANWCQALLATWDEVPKKSQCIQYALDFQGIPGRMQKIKTPSSKNVFVDFAHTPEALKSSLKSLKSTTSGQVGVVFGCGGDRDQGKRPLMGQISEDYSDFQILTNDNPRTESAQDIIDQIIKGFKSKPNDVILDRRQAIEKGISLLQSTDDVLLVAGKGHENTQIIGETSIEFSDEQVCKEVLDQGV